MVYLPNQSRGSGGQAQVMEANADGEEATVSMTHQHGIKHQTNLISLQSLRAEQTVAAPLSSYAKGASDDDDAA